jgi:hypothetical protein
VLGQCFDARKRMVDPYVHQECNSRVLGGRSAVIDFGRNAMKQAPVKTDVLPNGRMTDKAACNVVTARDIVASVLQDDCGGACTAEVRDGAHLRIHFDPVRIGQMLVLVPVETDALA